VYKEHLFQLFTYKVTNFRFYKLVILMKIL
jgi:hypothetical protein